MTFSLLNSIFQRVASQWPLLLYAATWTAILTMTVAVASLAPEIAFVSAISPTSAFSKACETEGSVRVPMDVPAEVQCFPAHLFRRSKVDLLVQPFLAAVIVAGSASVVRSLGLWEVDDEAQ
ncbi:Serine-rich adhesin for platelets like [Actinidia chinensis var. chinensis]|uniref:Serine-rich adhesin for platelets like n=1 Tax=Actinidia chinensis var. chinensis TaxID=1590841 RepID=A0A2R6PX45_ACTCC|nr:Serine-rich adhesin for platelets like [Actinidia chinensis var. chinensis]